MARTNDQIWKVLSGAPVTPSPARPEGLMAFKPDQSWVRRITDVTLPALSSKPHYNTRLSPQAVTSSRLMPQGTCTGAGLASRRYHQVASIQSVGIER